MRILSGSRPLILMVIAAFVFTGAVMAQSLTTGVLEGVVTDKGGKAVEGATITITGPQGVRVEVTGRDGRFSFRDLTPGEYTAKAEALNFGTIVQTEVEIVLNKRTQVPFVLTEGVVETVTVTSEAPLVDMKSTTVGAIVNVSDLVENIPLGRNFAEMFTLSPGVVSGGQSGKGNYSVSGSSGLENSYFVDGVNITNSGYGGIGSYNRVYGSLGSGVTNDFLEEVEVKEGGFEAEFGQATGGVINAIVKSGTNNLSGQVSLYMAPDSFESGRRTIPQLPDSVSVVDESQTDIGLSIGGPLVKDKLFWYAAYNPVSTDTMFIREVQDLDALLNPDTGLPLDPDQTTGGRMEERSRSNDNYAGKFTWFAHPNHRIEVTAFGDPSDGDQGPQRPTALRRTGAEGFSTLSYGGNNYSIKYGGAITSNLFVEAVYALHDSELIETGEPIYQVFDTNVTGGIARGGLGFSPSTEEEVDQISLKVSYVLGNHEFKVGYQEDTIEYTESAALSGPSFISPLPVGVFDAGLGGWFWDGSYYDFESSSGASLELAGDVYNVSRSAFGPLKVLTKNEETNMFFQWSWQAHPRVNIKAGLRRTEEYVAGGAPFELPFTVVRNTSGSGFSRNRLVDPTTPSQYDPTALTFPKETAPRLGITWDVLGDGRHKVYANWGEYYQRVTQDLAYRAFSNEIDISQNFSDAALMVPYLTEGGCQILVGGVPTPADCQVIAAATGLGGPTTVWDGTKLPYVEEILVGWSHEINPTLGLDIRYVHRELGRSLEDFSYTPQEEINNVLWGTGFGQYPFNPYPQFSDNFFGDYVLGNIGENTGDAIATLGGPDFPDFDKSVRDYDSISVVLNKRFSDNWVGWLSYSHARLVGNYEGLLRNDNGQDDPNITSLYDFPATPLMDGQFVLGPLNNEVEHNLKAYATYSFPMGLNIGGALRFNTGVPKFQQLVHPNDFYQLPGNGEVPGADPVYGAWYALDGDMDNVVLVLSEGLGAAGSQMTDGTLDTNGDLVFMDYTPSSTDVLLPNAVSGATQFLYDYTPIARDFNGREPAQVNFDLHFSYDIKTGMKNSNLTVALDIFNLFNSQETVFFDNVLELQQAQANPNFGKPDESAALDNRAFQAPRSMRLGLRWTF